MLLVIVMIIMLVVSSLAAANLINAMLERSLAKNQNYASLALQAAEAGIADGVTWLNMNQALAPRGRPVGRQRELAEDAITRDLSRDLNGDGDTVDPGEKLGSYTVTMRFKREWRDYSSPRTATASTPASPAATRTATPRRRPPTAPATSCSSTRAPRRSTAASASPAPSITTANSGYPVVEIEAVGQYGNAGYRKVLFDIARNKLDAQVEGAFTARSGVTAGGASNVDGRNHMLTGALDPSGSCGGDKPGILVDDGVFTNDTNGNGVCDAGETHLACDLNCDGDCGDAGDRRSAATRRALPAGTPTTRWRRRSRRRPWGALGLPQADFKGMFTKRTDTTLDQPCSTDQYYVWYAGTGGVQFNNASACNNYNGILVIHNENFDPDQWEACAGTYCTEDLNADGKPDHAPAVFDMNGNVQWTGVVIADQVVKVNGTPSSAAASSRWPRAGSSTPRSPATSTSSTAARRSPGPPTRATRRGWPGTASADRPR